MRYAENRTGTHFYCKAHNRVATHLCFRDGFSGGTPCCNPGLGGLMVPCLTIETTGRPLGMANMNLRKPAPPVITAETMKEAQAAKEAPYDAAMDEAAMPFVATLSNRIEQSLRLSSEDFRPQIQVNQSVTIVNVDVLDMLAVVSRIEVAIREKYHARGFAVAFIHRNGTDYKTVEAQLTW